MSPCWMAGWCPLYSDPLSTHQTWATGPAKYAYTMPQTTSQLFECSDTTRSKPQPLPEVLSTAVTAPRGCDTLATQLQEAMPAWLLAAAYSQQAAPTHITSTASDYWLDSSINCLSPSDTQVSAVLPALWSSFLWPVHLISGPLHPPVPSTAVTQ